MIQATGLRGFTLERLHAWADAEGTPRARLARIEEGLALPPGERTIVGGSLQAPIFRCPGLAAQPWHDSRAYPWTAELERAAPQIRAEFARVYGRGELRLHPEAESLAEGGRWDAFELFRMGARVEENLDRCPATVAAVERIPGAKSAGLVYFAALAPGAHIVSHCGPHNVRIRCHLGLVVPPACRMRVGTETRRWEEGRCLLFDDSFEHELWNDGDTARVVLILDVWHPDLTADEIRALSYLMSGNGR
jgi:aspartyl/asparaginyl beta-hydroxylase (cupin superfamily)